MIVNSLSSFAKSHPINCGTKRCLQTSILAQLTYSNRSSVQSLFFNPNLPCSFSFISPFGALPFPPFACQWPRSYHFPISHFNNEPNIIVNPRKFNQLSQMVLTRTMIHHHPKRKGPLEKSRADQPVGLDVPKSKPLKSNTEKPNHNKAKQDKQLAKEEDTVNYESISTHVHTRKHNTLQQLEDRDFKEILLKATKINHLKEVYLTIPNNEAHHPTINESKQHVTNIHCDSIWPTSIIEDISVNNPEQSEISSGLDMDDPTETLKGGIGSPKKMDYDEYEEMDIEPMPQSMHQHWPVPQPHDLQSSFKSKSPLAIDAEPISSDKKYQHGSTLIQSPKAHNHLEPLGGNNGERHVQPTISSSLIHNHDKEQLFSKIHQSSMDLDQIELENLDYEGLKQFALHHEVKMDDFFSNFTSLTSTFQSQSLITACDPDPDDMDYNQQKSRKNYRFKDRVRVRVRGGDGGRGNASFYRDTRVIRGPPDGGDGGRGGHVIFISSSHVKPSLGSIQPSYLGGTGTAGLKGRRTGKRGSDIIIEVPVGTSLIEIDPKAKKPIKSDLDDESTEMLDFDTFSWKSAFPFDPNSEKSSDSSNHPLNIPTNISSQNHELTSMLQVGDADKRDLTSIAMDINIGDPKALNSTSSHYSSLVMGSIDSKSVIDHDRDQKFMVVKSFFDIIDQFQPEGSGLKSFTNHHKQVEDSFGFDEEPTSLSTTNNDLLGDHPYPMENTSFYPDLKNTDLRPNLIKNDSVSNKKPIKNTNTNNDMSELAPFSTRLNLPRRVELDNDGDFFVASKGGAGGLGNWRLAATRRKPQKVAYPGAKGESLTYQLELKLIADVGLIGLPNAGKSTLLSSLSRAKPKIASYPFTTLTPQIGTVQFDDYTQYTIADLPGLIEGAHQNRGLGHEFLKHLERTSILCYILDMSALGGKNPDPLEAFKILWNEIAHYQKELIKRPAILIANKMDCDPSDFGNNFLHTTTPYQALERLVKYLQLKKETRSIKIFPASAKNRVWLHAPALQLRKMLQLKSHSHEANRNNIGEKIKHFQKTGWSTINIASGKL